MAPTPVFLPGEFHGQRSPVGYSPWGRKESDMIERLTPSHLRSPLKKHSLTLTTLAWGTYLVPCQPPGPPVITPQVTCNSTLFVLAWGFYPDFREGASCLVQTSAALV